MEYVCFVEGTLFVPRPLRFLTMKKEVVNTGDNADRRTTDMEKFIETVDRKARRATKRIRRITNSRRYKGALVQRLKKTMTSGAPSRLSLTTDRRMAWRTKRQDSVFKVEADYSKFCVTMWWVIKSNCSVRH